MECASHAGAFTARSHAVGEARLREPIRREHGSRTPQQSTAHLTANRSRRPEAVHMLCEASLQVDKILTKLLTSLHAMGDLIL